MLSDKLNKDHLKIVITDSGLGGLSVQAYLDKYLRSIGNNPNIDLIFFNSLYSHNYGYNSMPDLGEKSKIFNRALESMNSLNPDLILIACNTLSVVYPETEFSRYNKKKNVIGIIEFGIESSIKAFQNYSSSNLIILGTETTINSHIHKNIFVKRGIEENRIIEQACNNLETEIQVNPGSERVKRLLSKYLREAKSKQAKKNDATNILLACTHYGFVEHTIKKLAGEIFGNTINIINPNSNMALDVAGMFKHEKQFQGKITNKVISKVDINNTEINRIGNLIKPLSLDLFKALQSYELNNELF